RPPALSQRDDADDHRRLRRLEQSPHPSVAPRATAPGHHHRPEHPRLPLPSRHQQVEQNRAPNVQLREPQLARQAPGEPRGDHQPHRRHKNQHRPQPPPPTRGAPIRPRNRDQRPPPRRRKHPPPLLPRRIGTTPSHPHTLT